MKINIDEVLMILGEKDIEIFKLKQYIAQLETEIKNIKNNTEEEK